MRSALVVALIVLTGRALAFALLESYLHARAGRSAPAGRRSSSLDPPGESAKRSSTTG